MNTDFLARNRTVAPLVTTAPPPGSVPNINNGSNAVIELRAGANDAMRGRVSLLFLNTAIIALLAFYLWTRRAQGGG